MAKSVINELLQIFKSSISAVLPENLIRRSLSYDSASEQLIICGKHHNLKNKNVYIVGAGKAVQSMAVEVENILKNKIKKGIVSIPEGSLKAKSDIIDYYEGAKNNLPDTNAEKTTKHIKDLVKGLTCEDFLIVLISGGGSALLPLAKPPITFDEKIRLIKKLANSGADIKELNTVRKQVSDIKGGKLAIYADPAKVTSLILSDIVGDPVDLIASGPTVQNDDDISNAIAVIDKYDLKTEASESIKTVLQTKDIVNPFPKDNVSNYVIGTNKLSMDVAADIAKSLNYVPIKLSNAVTGNVRDVAKKYKNLADIFCKYIKGDLNTEALILYIQTLDLIEENNDLSNSKGFEDKDICLILGGEITVEVKGTGKGGRNQHLALEFSKNIHEFKDLFEGYEVYLLSAGTDGIDGPTDAAGAIGYLNLLSDAKKRNLDVCSYLENNDSYSFYKHFCYGDLHVITGHTGTNVMDIHLIVIKKIK